MRTSISYNDILGSKKIIKLLPNNGKWWSSYLYHFSDINNIASILNSGILYSRNNPSLKMLLKNDNASNSVISSTNSIYKDYVRLYFRPQTPTQYHNEGIRAKKQLTNLNAHCPVPVFLFFNPARILEKPNVYFSFESLASTHEVKLYSSPEELNRAPFDKIYHNSYFSDSERHEIIKARHAEIICRDYLDLQFLENIVVRTHADAVTLLNLLNTTAKEKFKSKIVLIKKEQALYFNRYLYLKAVDIKLGKLYIHWENKKHYNYELLINIEDPLASH